MKISIAVFTTDSPAAYTKMKAAEGETMEGLGDAISEFVWSPCIWKGAHRLKKNFLYADYLALDFDDGDFTIADATEYVKNLNLAAVIGTTKSHQKQKGEKGPCDRFRLVVKWAKRIESRRDYETNTQRMVTALGADDAAKDAGRFFWPCVDIVLVNPGQAGVIVKSTPEPPKRQQPPRRDNWNYGKNVPKWLADHRHQLAALDKGRNAKCFWFGCRLKELGFDQEETYRYISPYTTLTDKELRRTINQAYKY